MIAVLSFVNPPILGRDKSSSSRMTGQTKLGAPGQEMRAHHSYSAALGAIARTERAALIDRAAVLHFLLSIP